MSFTRVAKLAIGAVLALTATTGHAVMVDVTDQSVPTPSDANNENTPNEVFPLLVQPVDPSGPLRSEAVTAEDQRHWATLKSKILGDFGSRMTPEFMIPEGLRERTGFWFDIYTRYGEAHHIIHHVRYPWIVYRVVDVTETLLHGKGPTWLRRDRGEKMARAQMIEIRTALRRLARRTSYDALPPLERDLFEKLKSIPGPRRTVLAQAAQNVRTQLGQRDFFRRGLVNSSRYLLYMEEEFKLRGLPTELTRLPFVESSFNENAYSKVGASGIWQIMAHTGQAYMTVNDQIDERNSPLKATTAAARLLRSYYRAMGSWPLAITSYNNGIGNIQKAIHAARSRDLPEIIARYHTGDFKFASSNFFTCFLAALYAEKYNELIFKDVVRQPLQEREIVRLTGATDARGIMRVTGVSQDQLLRFNLDLREVLKKRGKLPRGYQLHLPLGAGDRMTQRLGHAAPASAPRARRARG
jgi:membrane-bound lytic murein transglycosylase D